MTDLTPDELRAVLDYNPATGVFVWRVNVRSRARAGSMAGYTRADRSGRRYRFIGLSGSKYLAHRLAWLYVHGHWPSNMIDHIDGNGLNNAIANLREATSAQNMHNRGAAAHNVSGFKGVTQDRRTLQWRANININGRQTYIGSFGTAEDAASAYASAAKQYHGEFAKS